MFLFKTTESIAAILLLDSDGLDDIAEDELQTLSNEIKNSDRENFSVKENKKLKMDKNFQEIPFSPFKTTIKRERSKTISNLPLDSYNSQFGLSASQIQILLEIIAPFYMKHHCENELRKFVLIGLSHLRTKTSYAEIAVKFDQNKVNIFRQIQEFNKLVSINLNSFIKWPKEYYMKRITEEFEAICGFPNVIGVFGTYRMDFENISNEEDDPNLLVLSATSDANMKITSLSYDTFSNFQSTSGMSCPTIQTLILNPDSLIPKDSHILAGAESPLCDQILTPYLCSNLSPKQLLFNEKLKKTRTVLYRAFHCLSDRFHRFTQLTTKNMNRTFAAIKTAVILHNFAIENEEDTMKIIYDNVIEKVILDYDPLEDLVCDKRDKLADKFFHSKKF